MTTTIPPVDGSRACGCRLAHLRTQVIEARARAAHAAYALKKAKQALTKHIFELQAKK